MNDRRGRILWITAIVEWHMDSSRKKATGVIYLVKRDGDGRWNISRDGKPAGGFTLDMSTALGIAYHAAQLEQSAIDVSVWSVQGGKPKKEWPADH